MFITLIKKPFQIFEFGELLDYFMVNFSEIDCSKRLRNGLTSSCGDRQTKDKVDLLVKDALALVALLLFEYFTAPTKLKMIMYMVYVILTTIVNMAIVGSFPC